MYYPLIWSSRWACLSICFCVSYAIVLKINIFYKFPSFLLSLHHPLNTKRESMAWGQVGQVVDLTSCCFRVAAVYLLTFVLRFVISTRGVWGGGLEGQTLMVIGCRTWLYGYFLFLCVTITIFTGLLTVLRVFFNVFVSQYFVPLFLNFSLTNRAQLEELMHRTSKH